MKTLSNITTRSYNYAYDEGERNVQEFKRLTLNGIRNIGMIQQCWNMLRKRTKNWAVIRMAIEDQLTVQRNWNLHPSNPNPDMTGLKDAYKSREVSNLGQTGQVRMEISVVTNPVQNAPVFRPTQDGQIILAGECENTLNHLGNCYGCNKPGRLMRDCPEKNSNQNPVRNNYNKVLEEILEI